MMSAPAARTSSWCTPLIAPWVPTGMKAGVRTIPCAVAISPVRAAPSVARRLKENRPDIVSGHISPGAWLDKRSSLGGAYGAVERSVFFIYGAFPAAVPAHQRPDERKTEVTIMAYTLAQFSADCRAALIKDPGPAGRELVRQYTEKACADADF